VERSAASELQTYIHKMTGVSLSIRTEGQQSGSCIYVGATRNASLKGVTYPTVGDENGEAWAIQAVDGDLFLCGAPARGPLYAVYHLLEDVLGVRWWNYWEESVPTGNAIVPADYYDSGVPAMEYRDVFLWPLQPKNRFAVRNRLNGWALPVEKNLAEWSVGGILLMCIPLTVIFRHLAAILVM
jgi:hypothetical protein